MLTRFAPSPTGYLHLGNLRTALLCYLYARSQNGQFMLRIDDTDVERSKQEYITGLKDDLAWMGLEYDKEMQQSKRFDAYDAAAKELQEAGRLYACYETAEELDIKRKMQLSRGLPPIYDREGLQLTAEKIADYEAQGRTPHYRFKMEETSIQWHDDVRGETHFPASFTSDPILIRGNGAYTYMLPSTVDDIEAGVTHVLRGEDHVSNTAIQIQLFEALGGAIPHFAHIALIHSDEGKLSKRKGSATIGDFKQNNIQPTVLASFLALTGTNKPVTLHADLESLVADFDISSFSRAPTTYSYEDIDRLNQKWLHDAAFDEVSSQLAAIEANQIDSDFWQAVRPNLEQLADAKEWWRICREQLPAGNDNVDFTKQAAELLPQGDPTEETWGNWVSAIKEATGRKGKELFMPLRIALTGMEHGPELKHLLPLIGRERAIKRLNGEAA